MSMFESMASVFPPIPKAGVLFFVRSRPRMSAMSFGIADISAPESTRAIVSKLSMPLMVIGIDGFLL